MTYISKSKIKNETIDKKEIDYKIIMLFLNNNKTKMDHLKAKKLIENPIVNIIFILFTACLSWLIIVIDNHNKSMGEVLLYFFIPLIIGLLTIITYVIALIISKRKAWITTVVGCLINLILCLHLA